MIAPARLAAYRALRTVATGQADTPHALEKFRQGLPDARDRALVTETVLGALRWQATLDHLIATLAKRPIDRLDPEVRDILRLAVFQLLFLDRVPSAATVRDAVDLARRIGKTSAAGFVNAVLRGLDRRKGDLPLPRPPGPDAPREAVLDFLSTALSHPKWLAERWLDRYGTDAALAWARFNNTPPPITIRANCLKTTREDLARGLEAAGIRTVPTRYAPHGLVVMDGNPLRTSLAQTGLFFVQDEASQLVAVFAGVHPGEAVLDLCAAPGGKTTSFAADIEGDGLVVACDVRPRRLALLRQTVAASGATRVRMARVDALSPLPFRDVFDCVVLDAPCSGLGTLRRDPEIRWRRQAADLQQLAAAQARMLARAAAAVRPGGRLVYATCSSEPEENEQVVEAFLTACSEFERGRGTPGARSTADGLAAVLTETSDLRTDPHLHGLEAFYAARLERRPTARKL